MDDLGQLVERLAIELYEGDLLATYARGAESWPHDREEVRVRYRRHAMRDLGLCDG